MKNPGLFHLRWFLPSAFLISFLCAILHGKAWTNTVSPAPHADFCFEATLLFGLGTMLAVSSFPVGCVLIFRRKGRNVAFFCLGGSLLYFAGIAIGGAIGGGGERSAREPAFMHLGERLNPLVTGIEKYTQSHGRCPVALDDLVPQHLPELPKTNMGWYPSYKYMAGMEAQSYEGNPWVIVMDCHTVFASDRFVYFPLQNYPSIADGKALHGRVIKLGRWALVHP